MDGRYTLWQGRRADLDGRSLLRTLRALVLIVLQSPLLVVIALYPPIERRLQVRAKLSTSWLPSDCHLTTT